MIDLKSCFKNTSKERMTSSFAQRNPSSETQTGSVFDTDQDAKSLLEAEWEYASDPDSPVYDPDVDTSIGAHAFRSNIGGTLGVVQLDTLNPDMTVRLQPSHQGHGIIRDDGHPHRGEVACELVGEVPIENRKVGYTTLIVGPTSIESDEMCIWTFFPGPAGKRYPPIAWIVIQEKYGSMSESFDITVREALELGFKFCKNQKL